MQRVVAQEDDHAPVKPGRKVEEIGEECRCVVRVVDHRHEDILNDVEQDVRREESTD